MLPLRVFEKVWRRAVDLPGDRPTRNLFQLLFVQLGVFRNALRLRRGFLLPLLFALAHDRLPNVVVRITAYAIGPKAGCDLGHNLVVDRRTIIAGAETSREP
jgi:hypothetical protein